MKKIVLSGVNLTEAGGLEVFKQAIVSCNKSLPKDWSLIAIVNSRLIMPAIDGVDYIEVPSAKKNWFLRLYWEYIGFFFLSLKIKPDIWFSMHDISPFVKVKFQAVYCHNPSPFYKSTLKIFFLDPKFYLFSKLYKYLYKVNYGSNDLVVVQQAWIRDRFIAAYPESDVVVSRPLTRRNIIKINNSKEILDNRKYYLIYPAYPRVFKNFEIIYEAVKLVNRDYLNKFEILLTISSDINVYTKYLSNRYSSYNIKLLGIKTKEDLESLYKDVDCLIFPSKLETWGLPISEAIDYGLPIIASDLEYAHETAGGYKNITYVDPDDAYLWAQQIERHIGKIYKLSDFTQDEDGDHWPNLWKKTFEKYNISYGKYI